MCVCSLLKAAHRREGELAARKDAAEESAKSHQLISQLQHLLAYTGDKQVGYMCQIQLLKQKTDDVQAELDMTYGIQEYYEGRLGTETAAVSRLKQQLRSLKSRANATQKCLVAEKVSRAALGRELSQCAQEIAAAQADCHASHQQLKAANAESAALRKQLKDAQQSASDAHVHSSELMREVETLKSDLASSKSKIKPAKVCVHFPKAYVMTLSCNPDIIVCHQGACRCLYQMITQSSSSQAFVLICICEKVHCIISYMLKKAAFR